MNLQRGPERRIIHKTKPMDKSHIFNETPFIHNRSENEMLSIFASLFIKTMAAIINKAKAADATIGQAMIEGMPFFTRAGKMK